MRTGCFRRAAAITILAVVAAAAAAAPAAAQAPALTPSSTLVDVTQFGAPAEYGVPNSTVARVEYCIVGTGALVLSPTTVNVRVLDVPEGVRAVVSPSLLQFSPDSDRLRTRSCAPPQSVNVTVVLMGDVEAPAAIRVVAIAESNPPATSSAGEARLLVTPPLDVAEHGVVEAAATEHEAPTPAGGDAGPGAALVVALGLSGALAGAGAALSRRRG